MKKITILLLIFLVYDFSKGRQPEYELPIKVGSFKQQVHHRFTTDKGLPDNNVLRIMIDSRNRIVTETNKGYAEYDGEGFKLQNKKPDIFKNITLSGTDLKGLQEIASSKVEIRSFAEHDDEIAVAANNGLYLKNKNGWKLVLPQQGTTRWAPVDVQAVAFDSAGDLWFAAPQGVGHRISENKWQLFTGADGLPFNDFTCIATGPESIWFGTTNGAIQYHNGAWSFRQGGRWLLDNYVNGIAVDLQENAWIATAKGVSRISYQLMTLADKAEFYQQELEKYHRRTDFGYLNPAKLSVPGNKNTATVKGTANDGQRLGFYLAAVSLGYAATGDPELKQNADKAFEAMAFLSQVTQGGTHPAPKGFVARCIQPTSGADPNNVHNLENDLQRQKKDSLWKILQPRWPVDETGEWYWKADGSVDELDGHFLGYGAYFDNVCQTNEQKQRVREVVKRVIDHLVDNGYYMIDHDGKPTRWGRISPDELNRNPAHVVERGLRSFSVLNYLAVAYHITGDLQYRKEYLKLALDHGYGMNGMTQPRDMAGAGSAGQNDDKMAFMNYYHLLRYETDPILLNMYHRAIRRHWEVEQYEKDPWVNFIYAACCMGKVRTDQWGTTDLTPPKQSLEHAIETLECYPLELIKWPMSNAHRTDMIPLKEHLGHPPGTNGHRVDGYVFPIDERNEIRWGRNPYLLDGEGNGTDLEMGIHFLLAYYLGLAHGFIEN